MAKTYPMNLKETEACKAFIDEHLKSGKIRKSQSLQASLFFFVQKKDGGLHPCQDYRYLNEHTVKNAYLLPLIVKDTRMLLYRLIFRTTWTGDTHEETDVLPDSRRDEDSWDKTTLIVKEIVNTSFNSYSQRVKGTRTMGLDCNAALWRSSLRLYIQDNTVFIQSQSEHGPGHGTYQKVIEG